MDAMLRFATANEGWPYRPGENRGMAAPYSIKFESSSPLMLRDGTITNVDIFRPDASGSFPALLRRTPYDKSIPPVLDIGVDAIRAAMRGYAVVIQDIRGRFSLSLIHI